MGGGASGDDDDMITAINVTPLVDVVLVLLIILMVTASYIVSRSIPMELPSADGTPTETQQRTLTVSIDVDGNYYIDAERRTEAQLITGIDSYVGEVAEADRRAVIAADGRITHSQVIHVIDLLRRHGVTRFAINVRPEDLAE